MAMNIEEFRAYCLSKSGVTESFPFDESTLVFKVGGKMFALCGINIFSYVNLKCDPEKSFELREKYTGITPGFHMSKKHWNSVETNGDVPLKLIQQLIDHSYELVFRKLTKKLQEEIQPSK